MAHASFHTPTPKHHDTCGEHSAHPLPTFDLGHAVVLAARYVWNLVTGDATLHDAMLGFGENSQKFQGLCTPLAEYCLVSPIKAAGYLCDAIQSA